MSVRGIHRERRWHARAYRTARGCVELEAVDIWHPNGAFLGRVPGCGIRCASDDLRRLAQRMLDILLPV